MTVQNAIKHCKEKEDCTKCGQEHKQLRLWLEELLTLRERQKPKKPILGNTFSDKFQKSIAQNTNNTRYTESQSYKCPVCQKNIIMLWEAHRNEKMYGCKCKDDFCKKCGQALDWE